MRWLKLDVALWGVVLVVWLVLAPFSRKTVRRESLALRARYLLPAVLGGMLFSPRIQVPWLGPALIAGPTWLGITSVAVTAVGVAVALWARVTLGRNWSGTVTVKEHHTLVQAGPYAFARHPIYSGVILMLLGTALGMGSLRALLALVPIVFALRFKMSVEERFMQSEFGDAYAGYRTRVKSLVPFVW